jgi:hypothetical protein
MTEAGAHVSPDSPDPLEPIDELLAAASVVLELDAARAEAWASGLLADWDDHDALLAALRSRTEPVSLAVAVALRPMLPGAEAVATELQSRGVDPPAFAPHVGSARPVAAWTVRDRHGTGTSVVVEYEHTDQARHDMLVEIDAGVAVDLLVGPPGVVDALHDEADRHLDVVDETPEAALRVVRDALQRVLDGAPVPLTDAYLLNHALVAARVGLPIVVPSSSPAASDARPARARDLEADALARATLDAALGRHALTAPPAATVAAAADGWRAAIDRGEPDAIALADEIGSDGDTADDLQLLLALAAAYVMPGPRAGMSPPAADAVDSLEWADWLGAAIPLVRAGVGADASPDQLVRNINRCPEVTTSIPKRDAPAVASAFACAMDAWRHAGVVDADLRLTALGAWLLPRALAFAWGSAPGAS